MADARQLEIIAQSNGSAWPNSLGTQFFTSLRRHLPEIANVRTLDVLTDALTSKAERMAGSGTV